MKTPVSMIAHGLPNISKIIKKFVMCGDIIFI